jgi:hypothetical protein
MFLVGYRRGLLFTEKTEELLKTVPKGQITETIENAIHLYFNGDMGRIEQQYKEALDERDRGQANFLVWKDRYDRARAEEDIKLKRVLTEWGYTRSHPPPFKNQDMTEPFPLLMQFGIKRTRREVLEFLEGME